jgi:hypothetical protein
MELKRPPFRSGWPGRLGRILTLAAVLSAGAAAAQEGAAPATLLIRVVDDSTGEPIRRAEVTLGVLRPLLTDSGGRLRIPGIEPGGVTLKASRLGYRPQRIDLMLAPGAELDVEIALREEYLALPSVVVEVKQLDGRLRAVRFYDRTRRGRVLAWDWHALRDTHQDAEAFLGRIPGFTLRPAGGDTAWVLESHRGPGTAPCAARVLVDGQATDARRLTSLRMEHVAGIEAYLGPATTPPDIAALASGAQCGVVVIWTRIGP